MNTKVLISILALVVVAAAGFLLFNGDTQAPETSDLSENNNGEDAVQQEDEEAGLPDPVEVDTSDDADEMVVEEEPVQEEEEPVQEEEEPVDNGEEDTSGTEDTTVQNVVVVYNSSGYSPSSVTVPAGSTVTFTNESSVDMWTASNVHPTHTVYPQSSPDNCLGSDFDACEGAPTGTSWSFTFTEIGSWDYHNHKRASHGGTIIVQ